MNKNDKKKISHSIDLLEHAVHSVKTAMTSDLHDSGVNLLTNMQQITIEIGNIIEEKEKNCSFVIKKLEALCEIYYQCSIAVNNPKEIEKQCTYMQEYIAQVKADLQKIPIKIEILFLPYQASMWDSLESVWKAAKKDSMTDCYVVPLPVYDVMPDNSLGELHYDGTLYPNYVPVTSYLEYDIERRHPDIIFFHNPYDGVNTVTRVPEQYYSQNLRNYTDLLVYIPYYMTMNGGPEDYQCYTPGILFADHVIVQPGIIYEKFCRVYTNFLKQNGLEQVLAKSEDKFLPFGSPKIDKLLQTSCNLADLPEQWRLTIQKKDGSLKKVVLYNLSITSLLQNNEKMLKKIDAVLTQFKVMKNEVVLLWRPHPLLKKTIAAMRPQLRDEYEKRIRRYQKEGWGIYDETPDSNLAMVISDAYYGDYSSLLVSYKELGKPILLQNIESKHFLSDKNKMQLWFFRQPTFINGELWFASQDNNGLYRYPLPNIQTYKTNAQTRPEVKPTETISAKLETMFKNESNLQEALYGDLIQYGDLLIFPPFRAKSIAAYHTRTKEMYYYALPEQISKIAKVKYHTGFVYGHTVYFIGIFSDIEMIQLDLETEKVSLCGLIPDHLAGQDLAENIGYCTLSNHKIFIPLASAHSIVEYDVKMGEKKLKKLPKDCTGQLKGVFHYTDHECLLLVGSKIISWNPDNGSCTEITSYPKTELDRVLVTNNQLYIFGLRNQIVYMYNLLDGKKSAVSCMHGEENRGISGRTKLLPIDYSKNHLVLFSLFYNRFIFIQNEKIQKEIELFTTDIPDIDFDEVFCRHLKTESRFYRCSLENFLNYIITHKKNNNPIIHENVGEKIYRTLCKKV